MGHGLEQSSRICLSVLLTCSSSKATIGVGGQCRSRSLVCRHSRAGRSQPRLIRRHPPRHVFVDLDQAVMVGVNHIEISLGLSVGHALEVSLTFSLGHDGTELRYVEATAAANVE